MPTTKVEIGAAYVAKALGTVWRVDRLLHDGVHVSLVSDSDPTRRKTIAASALLDADFFLPAPPPRIA